jgi:hypothetical protein
MEECCNYYIEIESTIGVNLNDVYLEIDTCTRPILISDIPDIPVSKITDLDTYLNNFLDNYDLDLDLEEIDCGTP